MREKRIKKVTTEYDIITTIHDRHSGRASVKTTRSFKEVTELVDEQHETLNIESD